MLDKIGKTVKNYNILSFINEYGKEKEKYKEEELDKFIENQKIKIKFLIKNSSVIYCKSVCCHNIFN